MNDQEREEIRRRGKAARQRAWRWRSKPLVLKRLSGKMQWVIKRFDKETLDKLSDKEIRAVFEKMARMNKWVR